MPPRRRASPSRCANRSIRDASSTCNARAIEVRLKTRLAASDLALTLIVVAVLGFSFVPMKVGLRELPPFALCGLRFLFAALPLVFFVKRPRIPWHLVAAYGIAIGVLQFGLLFLGIKMGMPAGLASLVIQMQVFFTMALGIVFLRDAFRRHNVIGALIATVGVALLAVPRMGTEGATMLGFTLVIGAALGWAGGNIVAKSPAANYAPDMFPRA